MDETQAISIAVDQYAVGAFIGYLLLLVGIGIYSSRFSSEGISEFFIGGRQINRFVVALSAVVSGRSAWLLVGVTGMAYAQGASAVWAVMGYVVVELFLFLYYARRLRNFSETYNCITVPDFFAERFNDKNGYLRIALVVVFLIFYGQLCFGTVCGWWKSFCLQLWTYTNQWHYPYCDNYYGVYGVGRVFGRQSHRHVSSYFYDFCAGSAPFYCCSFS